MMYRVAVGLVAVMGCAACAREQRSAPSSQNTAPAGGANAVEAANKLLDQHLPVLVEASKKLAAAKKQGSVAEIESATATIEKLAGEEAALYEQLSDRDREAVLQHMWTAARNTSAWDGMLADLSTAGITSVHEGVAAGLQQRIVLAGDRGPKAAMCMGFIVGHRRCCANRAGNGTCTGGPKDCYHSPAMISDSCPPCEYCPY